MPSTAATPSRNLRTDRRIDSSASRGNETVDDRQAGAKPKYSRHIDTVSAAAKQ
jgi:hypothetical protein